MYTVVFRCDGRLKIQYSGPDEEEAKLQCGILIMAGLAAKIIYHYDTNGVSLDFRVRCPR